MVSNKWNTKYAPGSDALNAFPNQFLSQDNSSSDKWSKTMHKHDISSNQWHCQLKARIHDLFNTMYDFGWFTGHCLHGPRKGNLGSCCPSHIWFKQPLFGLSEQLGSYCFTHLCLKGPVQPLCSQTRELNPDHLSTWKAGCVPTRPPETATFYNAHVKIGLGSLDYLGQN